MAIVVALNRMSWLGRRKIQARQPDAFLHLLRQVTIFNTAGLAVVRGLRDLFSHEATKAMKFHKEERLTIYKRVNFLLTLHASARVPLAGLLWVWPFPFTFFFLLFLNFGLCDAGP